MMDRELARKRPANEVATTLPRTEILTVSMHGRAELMAEVHRMAKRGEIGTTYVERRIPAGWAVKVVRISERPNWWQRNGLRASLTAAGILAFLGGVVILLRLLFIALAALMPFLIGAVILLAVVSVLAGGLGSISVKQSVDIRR